MTTERPKSGTPRTRGVGRGSTQFRLRFGMAVIAIVLSIFGARLVQLQAIDPGSYAQMAAAEGMVSVTLPAERGEILDRDGDPLAWSVDGEMIIADPSQTRANAHEIARMVANELDVDYFQTLRRLQVPDSRFQYVARRVPAADAEAVLDKVRSAGYGGLYSERDPIRDYPAHDVAANVLGFMGAEGEPLGGLEMTFDDQLSGKDGEATYQVGDGNRIPLGENSTTEPENGEDVELTIDRDDQWFVQRTISRVVEETRAESAMAVVMNTDTGEIMSLADAPTLDANEPGKAKRGDRGARTISDVIEPGSVQKALTFASLLDAGKITPRTPIEVPSELPRGDRVIHDYFSHGQLNLTATGVLAKSSNIGTVRAAERMSSAQLRRYLAAFGLGESMRLGVAGETRGLLPPLSDWMPITHDTAAFGQGIATNSVQMAAAINTIANGGVRVTPSLIKGSATDDAGEQVGSGEATAERVISRRAATQVTQMMEGVLDEEEGVAPMAAVPGYRVAGKTGTAQRVDPETGGYEEGAFNVSFAGFAPADDPQFTVYVVVKNPRNGGGGGSVGGPAFSTIMRYLLSKYDVPPTGTKPARLPMYWGGQGSDG